MENIKYKLGPKANYFYDPTNGKKVTPDKEVEFTTKDLLSKRTKAAINSMHLVRVEKEAKKEKASAPTIDLETRFRAAFEQGGVEEVGKAFKKAELRELAISLNFEVQEEDTKATLIEALQSDLYPEEEKEQ